MVMVMLSLILILEAGARLGRRLIHAFVPPILRAQDGVKQRDLLSIELTLEPRLAWFYFVDQL